MSKRITTCIKCQYFYLHDHITGKMRCANNARTWANDMPEELEEIQLNCEYWTEKIEPIKQGNIFGEIYEQLSMF